MPGTINPISALLMFHSKPIVNGLLKRMIGHECTQPMCRHGVVDSTFDSERAEIWQRRFVGLGNCTWVRTTTLPSDRNVDTAPSNFDCVSLDGRIDNRDELLERLRQSGISLDRGVSDQRLILAAYRAWGLGVFSLLLGDYAIALWDGSLNRLVCARDPLGLCPLFYHHNATRFSCGSSIRQLFAAADTPRDLSTDAVADYLGGTMPDPGSTIYSAIQRLPAAHGLEVRCDGTVRSFRFWDPRAIPIDESRSADSLAEDFRNRFLQAVQARLRTNSMHVAVHVSGGFDSAAVTAGVHHLKSHGNLGIEPVAFVNVADHPAADERSYVSTVLDRFPMPVMTTRSHDFWAFRPVPLLGQWQDEPYTAPYAARLVTELEAARARGIAVILAGSGGDEVGGSSFYLLDLLSRGKLGRFCVELRARAKGKGQNSLNLLTTLCRYYEAWLRTSRSHRTRRPPRWLAAGLSRRVQLRSQANDNHTATNPARDDLLSRLSYCWTEPVLSSCRSLYAHFDVEVRQPFLDRRIVEWALAVPPYRFGEDGLLKAPLRRAMSDLLPPAITHRPDKSDYLYYWDLGVRTRERNRILAMLDSSVAAERGFIDARALRADYQRYCRGAAINRRDLWHALTLESWLRSRVEATGAGDSRAWQ